MSAQDAIAAARRLGASIGSEEQAWIEKGKEEMHAVGKEKGKEQAWIEKGKEEMHAVGKEKGKEQAWIEKGKEEMHAIGKEGFQAESRLLPVNHDELTEVHAANGLLEELAIEELSASISTGGGARIVNGWNRPATPSEQEPRGNGSVAKKMFAQDAIAAARRLGASIGSVDAVVCNVAPVVLVDEPALPVVGPALSAAQRAIIAARIPRTLT